MYEPLLIGIAFPFLRCKPWQLWGCTQLQGSCKECRKTGTWTKGIFCANFAKSPRDWLPCRGMWCPECYTSRPNSIKFHVADDEQALRDKDNEDRLVSGPWLLDLLCLGGKWVIKQQSHSSLPRDPRIVIQRVLCYPRLCTSSVARISAYPLAQAEEGAAAAAGGCGRHQFCHGSKGSGSYFNGECLLFYLFFVLVYFLVSSHHHSCLPFWCCLY